MHGSRKRPLRPRLVAATALALVAAVGAPLPAGAWSSAWTKPKLVFQHSSAPTHAMDVDGSGRTHIATERGSGGIWYVTNAGGSWTSCQLSDGNDRQPSIVTEAGVVHIAFARRDAGSEGLYTASSDQLVTAAGCGWQLSERYSGAVSHPSLGVFAGTLSIAFRTSSPARLRFARGPSGDPAWTILETVDQKCCTSPPSLDLTTSGAARIAYGDGKRVAEGLKYAVRTGSGWKRSKASKGRVKQVTMVLEKAPNIGGTSNAPRIMFVIARKGTYYAGKATSGASGGWSVQHHGRHFARPDLQVWSNDELLLAGGKGRYWLTVKRGPIVYGYKLTGSGHDVKASLDASIITFARKKGTKGIYHSRQK